MSIDQDDTIRKAAIRSLNDQFRQTFKGGAVVVTTGIAALDEATRQRIFCAVQTFDAFDEANDPWREHDFGAFEVDGQRVFFKLEYYDLTRAMHSEDPVDPAMTRSVLVGSAASSECIARVRS